MDYEKRKNEILTDFFNSGQLKVKVEGVLIKLGITRKTELVNDSMSEVYFQLSKYNAEKLVTAFDKNPNSLIAIAVVITKRLYRFKTQNPDNPNNSYLTKVLHGSNYRQLEFLSVTDAYDSGEGDYSGITLFEVDTLNVAGEKWDKIKERLTTTEIEFIDKLMDGFKFYKRKPTNEFKEYRTYVFNKIKNMDLNKPMTPLEEIKTKLDMQDVRMFEIMYDEDFSYREKIKMLKFTEAQYLSQRRILLKKIKAMNIK
ncbi:hypothetical protein BDD43_2822 [Mucilaginibacter gracilis]|uniref:Uncharacterized protein n=1 Tax=Mucilaginibacter gracilis TaxID=423350 RepID=A0A495J116_9SPHI|nr:hypothetical protein [Mucilaginibacter gracilis]RKR82637.1 hypothetical protein BDD43_2822 [Mucilaginibacter gracilis]